MKKIFVGVLLSVMMSSANAVLIDFDSLATGTIVTNQFAEATFSAVGGNVITASASGLNGSSLPNIITQDNQFGFGTINIAFASLVDSLFISVIGINDTGDIGDITVTHGGGLSVVDIIGAGFNIGVVVDLSTFASVSQIAIGGITDTAGVGYDNISFDVAAVPEPSILGLIGLGLIGLGLARRKQAA